MSQAAHRARQQSRLVSTKLRNYLFEPVFVFGKSGKRYSRSDLVTLTESPCMRAVSLLIQAMHAYHITSVFQLYNVGLDGLLRCRGIGERSAWVAACVLGDSGYNVARWCDMKSHNMRTVKGSIRAVQHATRKQKHG